jgi:hypothetical protein
MTALAFPGEKLTADMDEREAKKGRSWAVIRRLALLISRMQQKNARRRKGKRADSGNGRQTLGFTSKEYRKTQLRIC